MRDIDWGRYGRMEDQEVKCWVLQNIVRENNHPRHRDAVVNWAGKVSEGMVSVNMAKGNGRDERCWVRCSDGAVVGFGRGFESAGDFHEGLADVNAGDEGGWWVDRDMNDVGRVLNLSITHGFRDGAAVVHDSGRSFDYWVDRGTMRPFGRELKLADAHNFIDGFARCRRYGGRDMLCTRSLELFDVVSWGPYRLVDGEPRGVCRVYMPEDRGSCRLIVNFLGDRTEDERNAVLDGAVWMSGSDVSGVCTVKWSDGRMEDMTLENLMERVNRNG